MFNTSVASLNDQTSLSLDFTFHVSASTGAHFDQSLASFVIRHQTLVTHLAEDVQQAPKLSLYHSDVSSIPALMLVILQPTSNPHYYHFKIKIIKKKDKACLYFHLYDKLRFILKTSSVSLRVISNCIKCSHMKTYSLYPFNCYFGLLK